ncbi:MAG: hypothetical protein ACXWHG_07175 [Thermoanaerobaculia bacterium]
MRFPEVRGMTPTPATDEPSGLNESAIRTAHMMPTKTNSTIARRATIALMPGAGCAMPHVKPLRA